MVGDLRPGETTEVIEPVRDEVPTAGEVPAAGADVQAPAGPDRPVPLWLTDPAPADSDPTDDGEQNTDASDAAGDPAEKPEIDAVTRAAQARAARVGESAKKKRFGKKAAKAAIESASADDLDASAGGNALRFAGDGGPGDDAAGNDSSGDAKSVDKSATEKTSADKKKSADKKESGRADTGQEPSPAKAWLLVVGESLLGLAIGLALTLIHLVTIPVTNTSVNPARSTAPALFVGGAALSQLWLFWVAPIVGGLIAGFAYGLLGRKD